MRYIILSILFFQFLLANENNTSHDDSIFKRQAQIQAIIDEQFPKKNNSTTINEEEYSYEDELLGNDDAEFNSNSFVIEVELPPKDLFQKAYVDKIFKNQKKSKNIYVRYEKTPKIIFQNQRFEIKLKATIATDEFDKIETRFINFKNVNVLNDQSSWEYGGKNNFYNKYYFKVKSEDFKMPTLQVLIYKQGKIYEIMTLKPQNLKYTKVAKNNEKFSNVIAKKLQIVTHKTKQYTNNKLLSILELKASKGNLEDFYLKDFDEQGVNSISQEKSTQNAIYYVIIPLHTKKITFDYYNSDSKSFERVESNVVLKNDLVSTQTDLNPNKSNILLYKRVASGFFVLFFFILYLNRKRFIYIFLTLILLIIFILYNLPNEMMRVKEGSNIYILPTNKSTVFYRVMKVQRVEILNKKDEFLKIMFKKSNEKKETIGWIKEHNIVKD